MMPTMQKVGSHKTSVSRKDGVLTVRYHNTDVVTVFENGTIKLNTGGWRTSTTKNRMNQASNQYDLGFQVYQRDFAWFVDWNGETYLFSERPDDTVLLYK